MRLDRPWVAAWLAASLYALFIAGRLVQGGGDPSTFVSSGDEYVNRDKAPANLRILDNSPGYDGQFYYRLALTPFTAEIEAHGVRIDSPVYRQQRILYPLIAHVLSGGRPAWVPWALIAVNFLFLVLIGWLGGRLAMDCGRHALWGLVCSLYAGFLLTLSRNTTEIADAAMLLSALFLLQRGRNVPAAVCLTLAVFARETTLLVAVAVLPVMFTAGRPRALRLLPVLILPAAAYLLWQAWLYAHWGAVGAGHAERVFGPPLFGLVRSLFEVRSWATGAQVLRAMEIAYVLFFVFCVAAAYRSTSAGGIAKWAWPLYLLVVLCISRRAWVEDWAFLRGFTEFFLIGHLILLASKRRWVVMPLSASLLFWLAIAFHALGR